VVSRKGTTARSTDDGGEQTGSAPEAAENATATFERAYYNYMTRLTSTWADPELQQQITEAANDCLRIYYDNQLPQDVWQGISDAWEHASKASNTAAEPRERLSTVVEANATSSQLLEQAQRDRQDRLAAAYTHYTNLVQQAPRDVAEGAKQAFREYVGDLRNAWSAADVDTMQAEDLLAIGQSVVQVCAGQMFVNATLPS
jgi:hypothetical protein